VTAGPALPPAGSDLAEDTALVSAEGGWSGTVDPRWNVGTNPNGGYLIAMAARAMLASADRPDPLSITAHYVTPPEAGPVAVVTETVRAGRRYATVAARVMQAERERVRLLGALGDLDAQQGPTRVAASPPDLPPPDDCVSLLELSLASGRPVPEVMRRYDLRLPAGSPFLAARTSNDPTTERVDDALEVTGWIRFSDRAEPSGLGLLAFADAFPPTLVNTVDVGWVPTIELTVHVRARPAPGWVLGSFRTRFLVDGLLEQDGELWGSDGRLVAQARQLALVLPRR
jgi:acyl-CoA thioesterase